MESPIVDVLIPASGSPVSLGATLASLASQRYEAFRVSVASPPLSPDDGAQIQALAAILEARGHGVRLDDVTQPVRSGGRRQALVDRANAPYVLVVDDGVFLEPDLIGRLVAAIRSAGCGFVGSSVVDLRFRVEGRLDQQSIEFWDGPIRPEEIGVDSPAWDRRLLHRGANLQHLRERLPRTRDRLYHVADVQGCVLYDVGKLRAVGGFHVAPEHGRDPAIPPGTDSAAQLRLLARFGGAGLFPSGAYRLTAYEASPRWDGSIRRGGPDRRPAVPGHPSSLCG